MPITATGLATGLDVEGLVSQLILADIQPAEQRINRSEADYQSKLSSYGLVKSSLGAFQTSVGIASNLGNFTARDAVSSQPDALTASADKNAAEGTYYVDVDALAKQQSLVSDSSRVFETTSDLVGTGTIVIQSLVADAAAVSVTIDDDNNTLAGVRDAINAAAAPLTASIINDGDGYRLVLTADETGLENRIDITVTEAIDDGGALTGLSVLAYSSTTGSGNMSQNQPAQDAQIRINNLTVTAAGNKIDFAIDGLSINLQDVTSTSLTLTVTQNTSLARGAVTGFVEGYNQLVDRLSGVSAYDSAVGSASSLTGDATIRAIESKLRGLLSTSVENVGGNYSTLAELGITTDAITGRLGLNTATLDAALADNPLDVANIFTALGRPSDSNISFVSSSSATKVGDYSVSLTQTAEAAALSGSGLTIANNNNRTITFDLTVNGETQTIEYATGSGNPTESDVAGGLTGAITEAFGSNVVNVTYDGAGNKLDFLTVLEGDSASIAIDAISNDSASYGLSVATGSAGTITTDARINGVAATYDSESKKMTGAVGSDVEGLVLQVFGDASGDLGTVQYAVGLGQSLTDLLDSFIAADGLIQARIDGLEKSIVDLDGQREVLQARANRLESRYRAQFNGLEALISQFTATQSFLSQALGNFVEPNTLLRR
jgi:flagellar hook-associated protein 2